MDIFGDRWFGELQWNNVPEQHQLNKHIIQMHKEFGIKLISTSDSHYPNPDAWKDRELYKRLGWLGKSKPAYESSDLPEGTEEIGYELFPRNGNQMWEAYKKYSQECGVEYDDNLVLESITNTHMIAHQMVDDFLPDNEVRLPDFVVPAGETSDSALEKFCMEGLRLKGLHDNEEYTERLRMELGVIAARGFSKYFLTMEQISTKAKQMMLTGPGRGSAAGSLVAYALDITQVDPLKYGLQFSRFMIATPLIGIIDENSDTKQKTEAVQFETDSGKTITLSPEVEIKVKRNDSIISTLVKNLQIGDEILSA